jgi:hypothetical protein
MCKEYNFIGEFVRKSYKTRINDTRDVIEQSEFIINIKVEKVGAGAYKANNNYYDSRPVRIFCGFLDEGNDELVLIKETNFTIDDINYKGTDYNYLYFVGKNEQIVRSSKLIRLM